MINKLIAASLLSFMGLVFTLSPSQAQNAQQPSVKTADSVNSATTPAPGNGGDVVGTYPAGNEHASDTGPAMAVVKSDVSNNATVPGNPNRKGGLLPAVMVTLFIIAAVYGYRRRRVYQSKTKAVK